MFVGQTFASYLPLFNVHAVFVPSNESGVSDGERKDTALSLYRSPAGSKRGIIPGDRWAAERALRLAPDTDYPILVANDDFYGGLGGRYAITTRSHNSGTMVLRHELGHNFGNVGEEYDGGQVYSGANHSRSASLKWDHWIDSEGQVQEARNLARGYPWKNLAEGPITVDFTVPEGDENGPQQIGIDISSVGWETPEDVKIFIDGEEQRYEGVYTEGPQLFQAPRSQGSGCRRPHPGDTAGGRRRQQRGGRGPDQLLSRRLRLHPQQGRWLSHLQRLGAAGWLPAHPPILSDA